MSAIPDARKYEQHESHRHSFDRTGLTVREQACRRFDGKLHNHISSAKSDEDWEAIADEIIKAHRIEDFREPHGLRNNVLKRFIEEAPGPAKRRFYEATKPRDVVVVNYSADRPKKTRAEIEARRSANRAARLAAQPVRGDSSGGGRPGQGNGKDKQKGGKKH